MNFKLFSLFDLDNYPKYRYFWHICFWASYILFITLTFSSNYSDYPFHKAILYFLFLLFPDLSATYFTLFLISKFLFKKRYTHFFIFLITSSFIIVFIQHLELQFIRPVFFPDAEPWSRLWEIKYFVAVANIYPIVGIASGIKFVKGMLIEQKKTKETEQQKLEAELKFLKSQIHPHFLFNTLNNLYALTLDKSDEAPEVVLRLSNLLDYILYKTNDNLIAIGKEIKLIENYIELEKIRYGDEAIISFQADIESESIQIAPLVLLPFVENSFKHGLSQHTDNLYVDICLTCKNGEMNFSVKNSKNPVKKVAQQSYSEGIGLKNVKRRLALIYPDKHALKIEESSNNFYIELNLTLY